MDFASVAVQRYCFCFCFAAIRGSPVEGKQRLCCIRKRDDFRKRNLRHSARSPTVHGSRCKTKIMSTCIEIHEASTHNLVLKSCRRSARNLSVDSSSSCLNISSVTACSSSRPGWGPQALALVNPSGGARQCIGIWHEGVRCGLAHHRIGSTVMQASRNHSQ